MSENRLHGRIVNKHDIEANWLKATNFIPMLGETIVYDPDATYPYARQKIGDGVHNVNDLPFVHVHGDWAQSDENAADYVKGRTHYESSESVLLLNDELEYTPVTPDNFDYVCVKTIENINSYNEFIVDINSTQYHVFKNQNESGKEWIGNYGREYGTVEDSGEEFLIEWDSGEDEVSILHNTVNGTITVTAVVSELHQLDEKYIPDTIARTADMPTAITNEQIDEICGAAFVAASEVKF